MFDKVNDMALRARVKYDMTTSALERAARRRLHEVAVDLAGEEGGITLEYVLITGIVVILAVAAMAVLGNAIMRRARDTATQIDSRPNVSW